MRNYKQRTSKICVTYHGKLFSSPALSHSYHIVMHIFNTDINEVSVLISSYPIRANFIPIVIFDFWSRKYEKLKDY